VLVVPDDAELHMLELVLAEPLMVRLYVNDHAPADGDLAADYQEMERVGYAPIALEPAAWRLTAGLPALAVQPAVEWIFLDGPPVTVYGYFMTWRDTGRLAWPEPFARPQIVEFQDDSIRVVPKFTLRDLKDCGT